MCSRPCESTSAQFTCVPQPVFFTEHNDSHHSGFKSDTECIVRGVHSLANRLTQMMGKQPLWPLRPRVFVPSGHTLQNTRPVTSLYVLAGQGLHSLAPSALLK